MSGRCLSELALERHLAQPAEGAAQGHLATCERCSARLASMRAEGEDFRRFVYPRTLEAVTGGAPRKAWSGWLAAGWGSALAAAAAVAIIARPAAPPDDYTGTKGAALSFAVFAAGPGGAHSLDDGARVPATAALRFRVHPSAPCHLWVVSADAAGEVSRIYPAAGEGGALVSGNAELPGGAVLDGRAGPERFYALCARKPVAYAEVERSVRTVAARGPEAVRATRLLEPVPAGATQASMLVEKTP